LTEELELRPQDRVLVVAPHPDDESIGAGGLLQVAGAIGAAVRVLVLTDGDNNPWPQRWIEKRWQIGAAERARWGARRRDEARAALRILGVAESDAQFLGFPDLGLTDLLMHSGSGLVESLRRVLEEFAPTVLIVPAISDRHPDHNAAHVSLRLALAGHAESARLLTFAVHGGAAAQGRLAVPLDEQRRRTKQAAILAHATQMQFSRGRFLAFAGEQERFQPVPIPAVAEPMHPLSARIEGDRLRVTIDLQRWGKPLRDEVLLVALHGDFSWRSAIDPAGGQTAARAAIAKAQQLDADVALPPGLRATAGFVKLARREPGWRVFDRFGWQAVAI
jgi:LmbE family N-acetylglucosaminyl deacetylase